MQGFDRDGGGGSVAPVYLDVHGVSLVQIFPTRYDVKYDCDLLGSPCENGTLHYDNKVVKPATVSFKGIVKYSERNVIRFLIKHLKQAFLLSEMKCSLYSKSGSHENMLLKNISETGESSKYDGIEVSVELSEYLEHS